jgi:hypothetical protein
MHRASSILGLLALALLPATALASAPRAARYEAYPAVGWQEVDSASAEQLTRLAYGDNDPALIDTSKLPPMLRKLGVTRRGFYWQQAQHPGLRQYLPRVRFLRKEAGVAAILVAQYEDRLYGLRSLNKLLTDVGYKFDASEVPAIAKVAVLWTLMDRQASLHSEDRFSSPDSAALATAIPAVTFRKIGWGERDAPAGDHFKRGITIDLTADGKSMSGWLQPNSPDLVPLWFKLDGHAIWFDWIRPPGHGPTAPPAPQK